MNHNKISYFSIKSNLMRLASWKDRKKVIDIIATTFEDNPGSVWLLRTNANRKRAIRCLARYVFLTAYNRDGAWISSNEMGMALCYKFNKKAFSILETWCKIRFAILYANIKKRKEIKYREKYRRDARPSDGNYLYFWFFGVKKGGGSAGFEISKEIMKLSEEKNLPIYLETAMEKNMKVYERYGYSMFHFWEEKEKNIQFWFMKREV